MISEELAEAVLKALGVSVSELDEHHADLKVDGLEIVVTAPLEIESDTRRFYRKLICHPGFVALEPDDYTGRGDFVFEAPAHLESILEKRAAERLISEAQQRATPPPVTPSRHPLNESGVVELVFRFARDGVTGVTNGARP